MTTGKHDHDLHAQQTGPAEYTTYPVTIAVGDRMTELIGTLALTSSGQLRTQLAALLRAVADELESGFTS